ncbi:response regulator [Paraburkholderia caledonica]|uniref:DNA-binding response OmpR family regulator n=1 Tax=Paraburkholderia caledonica TaxID=134536 RepID=A0AB73ILX5_9BURK|nr:DNA-binding response OmpR family regulator [Paraburkholderia caledonica]
MRRNHPTSAMLDASIRILLIDDDADTCKLLQTFLATRGIACSHFMKRLSFGRTLRGERPSIIVLDVMMPRVDGWAVLMNLCARGDTSPVIMLSAHGVDLDRVIGLQLGADEYMSKPCSPDELLARLHAVRRRRSPDPCLIIDADGELARFGRFRVDFITRTLFRDGELLRLANGKCAFLQVFVQHPMETLSRSTLVNLLHGSNGVATERGIDLAVWRLRRIL